MKTGKALIAEINACKTDAFWWLGQQSFAVRLGGRVLYFDLFLAERPDRRIPPLLRPEEILNADIVFGSHDHDDHIDRAVWKAVALASPNAVFVCPKPLLPSMEGVAPAGRIRGLDDGETVDLGGVRVTGVAAAHEFLDPDPATGRHPYLGYIAEAGGRRVYHAGDTCRYDGLAAKLRKPGALAAMFLPINGRDGTRYRSGCIGNMTFQEAADLAGEVGPGIAVPAHFEMFASNLGDPVAFGEYLEAKYPAVGLRIPTHGMRTDF